MSSNMDRFADGIKKPAKSTKTQQAPETAGKPTATAGAKPTASAAAPKEAAPVSGASDTLSRWQKLASDYESICREQVARNNADAAEAAERTLRNIEAQIAALNEQYGQTNKQLYRDYRESGRDLPQQLAAAGLTGGMSESSRVRLEAGYQESLGENERERLRGITELRGKALEENYEREQETKKLNRAAENELREQLRRVSESEYSETAKHAEALAAVGDFSGYRALGYSDEEIRRLYEGWAVKNPKLARKLYG